MEDFADSFDFLFKIILVGDAGVGKTCIVQRFKNGIFIERQANTIGVDFTLKTIMVDGKKIKVLPELVYQICSGYFIITETTMNLLSQFCCKQGGCHFSS